MAPIKIEFSKAEQQGGEGFPPIDAGLEPATFFEIKYREEPTWKAPAVEFTFQLPDHSNRRMWRLYFLSHAALPFLQRMLSRFGFSEGDLSKDWDEAMFDDMRQTLLGEPCVLKVTKEKDTTWGSEEHDYYVNNVEDVFPPDYAENTGRGW